MANNTIQIRRSPTTAAPATLNPGELAYSNVGGGSGVLYIGSTDGGTVVRIGGVQLPGTLVANQALVANSTLGINLLQTSNLVLQGTAGSISANGGYGTAGWVLFSGGSGANAYWASSGAIGVNVASQYAWTNTQSFSNTISFYSIVDIGNSTITTAANLVVQSNTGVALITVANGTSGIANVNIVATGVTTQSNSTTNTVLGAASLTIANTAGNTMVVSISGLTPSSNSSLALLGNSISYFANVYANAFISAAGEMFIGTINSTSVGATIVNNSIDIGNTTVNVTMQSTFLSLESNSTTSANLSLTGLAVTNTALGNLVANNAGLFIGAISATTNGATVTTTGLSTGNTLVNTAVTPVNLLIQANSTVFTNVTSSSVILESNSTTNTNIGVATISLGNTASGTTTTVNVAGVYTTGVVNGASHQTSTTLSNTSGFYPTTNALALGNSIGLWVISANSLSANSITVTGGTIASGNINVTGYINASTNVVTVNLYATTINASANVITSNVFTTNAYITTGLVVSNTGTTYQGTISATTVGATIANTGLNIGNTLVNTALGQTTLLVQSNSTTNTVVGSGSITISNTAGQILLANVNGVYPSSNASGQALGNSISYWTSAFINTLSVSNFSTTNLNVTGYVNASANMVTLAFYGNSIALANSTVTTLANASGLFPSTNTSTQAIGNTISYFGNAYITNVFSTLVSANLTGSYANITGQVNTATFFASTSANVGANVQLTTTALTIGTAAGSTAATITVLSNTAAASISVGNGTAQATNTTIVANGITIQSNTTTNTVFNSSGITVQNTLSNSVTVSLGGVSPSSNGFANLGATTAYYNSGYISSLNANTGTFAGAVTVSGNLTVSGTVTTLNTTQLTVLDNMIELGSNNILAASDVVDMGWFSPANTSSTNNWSGVFRIAGSSTATVPYFKILSTNTNPNTAATVPATISTGMLESYLQPYGSGGAFVANSTAVIITANSTVVANIIANNITLSTALGVGSGGTGLTSLALGSILIGNGTSVANTLAVPGSVANGQVLQITNNLPAYGVLDGGIF